MRRLMFALASVALLGCGGSDSTGPFPSAEGTWSLQSIDNTPLPYTTFTQASPFLKEEIVSDTYVLAGDGTYTDDFVFRETSGTDVSDVPGSDDGTWTQSGDQIHIASADPNNGSITARINSAGTQVTIDAQGFLLLYVKQ